MKFLSEKPWYDSAPAFCNCHGGSFFTSWAFKIQPSFPSFSAHTCCQVNIQKELGTFQEIISKCWTFMDFPSLDDHGKKNLLVT